MKIIGDEVRRGEEFRFTAKPTSKANTTFVTVVNDKIIVTRRASDLFTLRNDHPVVAHRMWAIATGTTHGLIATKAVAAFAPKISTPLYDEDLRTGKSSAVSAW